MTGESALRTQSVPAIDRPSPRAPANEQQCCDHRRDRVCNDRTNEEQDRAAEHDQRSEWIADDSKRPRQMRFLDPQHDQGRVSRDVVEHEEECGQRDYLLESAGEN